jgi:hypothetical protein
LRLLPHVDLLLQIIAEGNQIRFAQERAVHEHACRSAIVANAYGNRQVRIPRYRWPG